MARTKTMQEKRFTFDAWECAYNALATHVKYIEKDYINGLWLDTERELNEEEKTEIGCYEEVMQYILNLI